MKKIILSFLLGLIFTSISQIVKAQPNENKAYFRQESGTLASDENYGSIIISTQKGETKVIQNIMAYGENIKALDIQVNDAYPFKLAPAPTGLSLNYIGTSLNIVLKDGDKAIIDFAPANKPNSDKITPEKHIYVSGYSVKQS